ncbi:hypothetical protein [Acinetobacter venetianus]|uniref:hypothetical protein n=1 Tax=Acinetobacter venetianus TaxID=52133 RepID=UPI00384D1567
MKKILSSFFLIFSITLTTYSTNIYAGAAEKWEYDVTPDTDQKLKLKGHKVDAYGNAANDYEYNRKIDPKTAANKTKMGKVGFGRLLKISGWGLIGAAALEGLLESVDWIMDPEAQSIWRYKKIDFATPGCVGHGYLFQYQIGEYRGCPIDAVRFTLNEWSKNGASYEFVKWDTYFEGIPDRFTVKLTVGSNVQIMPNQQLNRKKDPNAQPEQEKEYLTPEDLADYANHTHSDFSNPELAPKLEPKYSPDLAPDLWKPANPWEYDNSPTVDEVKKELEQASPEPKDDTIKENEPDPETGAKSFSLPAFCSWATSVCEFIDWFKKEPEQDNEPDQPDIDDQGIFNKNFDTSFSLSKQCPADIPFSYQTKYLSGNFTFSLKWLCIIFTFLGYPLVFASHCVGVWILYEAVTRKQINWR